jgi:uncharacterized protein YceK
VGELLQRLKLNPLGAEGEVSRAKQHKNTGQGRYFLEVMRIIIVVLMACLLSGCGSIISRTIPGQGHGNQYYPGVKWDVRDSAWRYLTVLDLTVFAGFRHAVAAHRCQHGPYE